MGIGTTSPSRQLTISKSSNTFEQLELRTTGGIVDGQYTGIKFTQTTTGATTLGYIRCNFQTDGSTSMSFAGRDGVENMRIADNGNVGIGITEPAGLLDIYDADTNHRIFTSFGGYFGHRYQSTSGNHWSVFFNTNNMRFMFLWNTNSRGYFQQNSDEGPIDFTGQHRGFVEDILSTEAEDYKGLIVSANKNTYNGSRSFSRKRRAIGKAWKTSSKTS